MSKFNRVQCLSLQEELVKLNKNKTELTMYIQNKRWKELHRPTNVKLIVK